METSWRFRGGHSRYAHVVTNEPCGSLPLRVGVDAGAAGAVLCLHLGAVTRGARAVGLAGLLDGQVHGGAGSRLKTAGEQVAAPPRWDMPPTTPTFPHILMFSVDLLAC